MTDARDEDEEELTTVGMRADVVAATKKAKSQRPWLVIVSGSGGIGKTYRIANGSGSHGTAVFSDHLTLRSGCIGSGSCPSA